MKLSEMLQQFPIGSRWVATVDDGSLHLRVRVIDLRSQFGRLDAEVAPIGGWGSTWVDTSKLRTEQQAREDLHEPHGTGDAELTREALDLVQKVFPERDTVRDKKRGGK